MKKGQSIVEYMLIFALVAVACGIGFATKFDLKAIKSYVFARPVSTTDKNKIEMGSMTE